MRLEHLLYSDWSLGAVSYLNTLVFFLILEILSSEDFKSCTNFLTVNSKIFKELFESGSYKIKNIDILFF